MSMDTPDDLDALLNRYEAEAAASTATVIAKQRGTAAGREGMQARREAGLAAPLQDDNRSRTTHTFPDTSNTSFRSVITVA